MDIDDWHEFANAARHLLKQGFSADPAKLQISMFPKPDFLRNIWLIKANKLLPCLALAVGELLSAHAMPFAAERNWSAWVFIYVTLRNCLGLEKAEE